MKFLSKKLISVVTFAAAGLLGMGNVSAAVNPAQALFAVNQENFKSDFYKQNVVFINKSFSSLNLSDEAAVESFFVDLYFNIKKLSAENPGLTPVVKIACLMKGIEESLVKNLEVAFLSKKLATTARVMEVVITKGFAGNRVAGVIRDLTEECSLRKGVITWGKFHADKLARFFDPARAAEVEAERKAKAGATAKILSMLGGMLGLSKHAEAPKAEAAKPAEEPKAADAKPEEKKAEVVKINWFNCAMESINTPDFNLEKAQTIAQAAWIQKNQDAKNVSMEQVLELKSTLSDETDKLKMQFLGWLGYIAQLPCDKDALAKIAQTQQFEALFAQIGLIYKK